MTAPTPFSDIDTSAISRVLSQLAERPDDLADVYFERSEEIELPAEGVPGSRMPGICVRREEGLAVRLLRNGSSWLAARDAIGPDTFSEAVRRVARALPAAPYPQPSFGKPPLQPTPEAPELVEMRRAFDRALRAHNAVKGLHMSARRHRRWVRVIGGQVASATEAEQFYSAEVETPWGKFGQLFERADESAAEALASSVTRAHAARESDPPEAGKEKLVLGPAAAAVLLHEAVAHALEADILARGGHPEAAIGVEMGSSMLDVFDDPRSAPLGVRRVADDEGFPTVRRCLLRRGKVEQPICDVHWSRRSDLLLPGAGRRGDRHDVPGPRSTHLELVPGQSSTTQLLAEADGGLYLPEAVRGYLDPLTGQFTLHFPYGRRIQDQTPGEAVGPCSIRAHVSELLMQVVGVGREARSAGAGWCAKEGVRLPVWATSAEIALEDVEVRP